VDRSVSVKAGGTCPVNENTSVQDIYNREYNWYKNKNSPGVTRVYVEKRTKNEFENKSYSSFSNKNNEHTRDYIKKVTI
jgi:hypothetical protein